jgi:hypothetical protein
LIAYPDESEARIAKEAMSSLIETLFEEEKK